MKKLNETSSAKINVLGEGELEQVVGGWCHRKRHCGGYYKPRYNHCKKYESYEEPSYSEPEYTEESSDYSEPEYTGGNQQSVSVSVSIDVRQVQG